MACNECVGCTGCNGCTSTVGCTGCAGCNNSCTTGCQAITPTGNSPAPSKIEVTDHYWRPDDVVDIQCPSGFTSQVIDNRTLDYCPNGVKYTIKKDKAGEGVAPAPSPIGVVSITKDGEYECGQFQQNISCNTSNQGSNIGQDFCSSGWYGYQGCVMCNNTLTGTHSTCTPMNMTGGEDYETCEELCVECNSCTGQCYNTCTGCQTSCDGCTSFCVRNVTPVNPFFTDVFTTAVQKETYMPGVEQETMELKSIGYETYVTPTSDLVNDKMWGQIKHNNTVSGDTFPFLVTEN